MANLESVERVSFVVETLTVRDGQKLGRIRPDADGYYTNFPVAALGVSTRNNTYYDVAPFVKQITEPGSHFNVLLSDGTLYGEYGHPKIEHLDHAAQLNRLCVVDEERVSHHFRSVKSGDVLESGGRLIVADIKPTGRYGKYLKESLEEPHMNTAFSLRSITQDRIDGQLRRRSMRKLVTFDAVAAGGYVEASKRFAPNGAVEGLDIAFIPGTELALFNEVALESFANSELAEIFGTNNVELQRRKVTVIRGTGLARFDTNEKITSLYHELVKGK